MAPSTSSSQQITKTLAATFAPSNVTVNCLDPGPVNTGYADKQVYEAVASRMPFHRWGTPDDTANLVEWLVTDMGGWMTGQTLVSNGGWSLA